MISKAQTSLCDAYVNGGPGVFVSGIVWLLGAITYVLAGFTPSIVAFFFAGMAIYPVSVIISKKMRPEAGEPDKKLSQLGIITLPILFGGLYLGYLMSKSDPHLFYPVVAVAIGIRYLFFKPIYGLKDYWVLGSVLIAFGLITYFYSPPIVIVPAIVGLLEIAFGYKLTKRPVPQ